VLHVEGDAALVAVEHREVQAVDGGQVAQLDAGDVTLPGRLQLDDVGTEPRQDLGGRGAGLYVRHVEDPDALEGLTHKHLLCAASFGIAYRMG
jgi:hypothetical protein